ncbi:MAG TPA: hypothetical protein VGC34_04220 [Steroidobacteraceae bacterium]
MTKPTITEDPASEFEWDDNDLLIIARAMRALRRVAQADGERVNWFNTSTALLSRGLHDLLSETAESVTFGGNLELVTRARLDQEDAAIAALPPFEMPSNDEIRALLDAEGLDA